jgi:O-antigen ligase
LFGQGHPVISLVGVTIAVMALVGLVYPVAILLSIVAAGALLTFWRPDLMLGALAMSVPVQTAFIVEIDGRSITVTKLVVACLVLGWLPRAVQTRVSLDRITWGYLSVLVALIGSVAAVEDPMRWLSIVYQWGVAIFVYIVARSEVRTIRDAQVILGSMAMAVVGISAYSILQVLTDDGPPSFFVNGVLRAYGTFGEPNPLAAYLEMSVPLLMAVLALSLVTRHQPPVVSGAVVVLLLTAVAAGTITLVLTQSRGGWLGFMVAMIVIAGMVPLRWRFALLALGVCAFLVVLQSPVGSGWWTRATGAFMTAQERVHVTPANWANEERRAHWEAAWRMFLGNPLNGVGAGEFSREFRQYTPEWRFRVSRGHAHNGYLQLAAENGVPGLLSFIVWCGLVITALWRRMVTSTSRFELMMATGSVATFVAFLVHSMVDYLNVLSLGIQIALVIAMGMARFSAECVESDGRDFGLGTRIAAQHP